MFRELFHRKLKSGRHLLSVLTVVLILIYLSGCSTAKNYKTLSFFFDGVAKKAIVTESKSNDSINNPDTLLLAQNAGAKPNTQSSIHPPYQDRQCNSCHDQSKMGKLVKSPPELCYQCHEDFNSKYKIVHGPVGGGQCTQCHNPHMSANKNLLVRTNQSLCFYCHDSKQVMETEAHLTIKDSECTVCHNPHGGENRNFLR
jgi:predicted CXXCH cytochrome family protein